MKKFKVIIIGGGAAGCAAALKLKEASVETAILEAGDRLLKKLLVTGNGRCNITNDKLIKPNDVTPYFTCHDPSFDFLPLFEQDASKAIEFFADLGLPLTTLDQGKMYPKSLQASSVSDLIRLRLNELEVPIFLKERVKTISFSQDGFSLHTQTNHFQADFILIAVGGQAMPGTGSDGSLNKVIRGLGHRMISPLPALVQLKTDFPQLRALAGVKADAHLTLLDGQQVIREETGELLFTDYGVSGPPVLQLSRFASVLLSEHKQPTLIIDLFPELSPVEVLSLILRQRDRFPQRETQFLLNGIVHKKLIPVLLRQSGLDKMNRPAGEIDLSIYENLSQMLTNWQMTITDTNGFANSQSTLGGVDLSEINPQTMASKKANHLFFAGEVLDVCGASGGYNLQWAWSSAFAAAEAIINQINPTKNTH